MPFEIADSAPPSFARRALAYLTDLAVIYGLAVITLIACVMLYGQVKFGGDPRLMQALATASTTRSFIFWAHAAIYLSYFTLAQWYAGRTIGKLLFGLRVVHRSGAELSFSQSLGRTLGYLVSGQLTLGVGFLLPFFRRDGRTLHDLLSGTDVQRMGQKAAAAEPSAEPLAAPEADRAA